MSDKELEEYIKKVEPNFNSHIEKGTIEMSNEYYNLLEERIARLINENQQLKEVNNYSKRHLYKMNKERLEANLKLVDKNKKLEIKLALYKSVIDEVYEWLKYKAEQMDKFNITQRKETGAFWFSTRGEIDTLLDKANIKESE